MAFWGIEVKPGKPYTHSSKDGNGRLRISQATLAIGSATLKSLVQCNVGDKRPVLLCALLPDKTESLQLDLEFDEAEDVMFSVIGPRGVYLTGYYVGHNRQSHMRDDSESFGEDIANSEAEESNRYSDEDEYEDSFINDDEPEPLTPSPASSSRDDDEDEGVLLKNINENGGHKRLKKRYQSIESDDDMSAPEIDDEDDFPISYIGKNNKPQASGKRSNTETTAKVDKEIKHEKADAVSSQVLDSKDKVGVEDIMDDKTRGKEDQLNMSSAEVVLDGKLKTKKKRRETSKEKIATDPNQSNAANGDKSDEQKEVKTRKKRKAKGNSVEPGDGNHIDVFANKSDVNPNDTVVNHSLEELDSAEKNSKPSKKRKVHIEENNLLAGAKQEDDQQAIDKCAGTDCKQSVADEKKVKKTRRKTRKTQELDENTNMNVEDENNKSLEVKNEESGSCNKKTLSNGLVIEDLVTGNSKGKVAAAGRKVKVQYVVKLKENGQVIDSNGKSPHKFRLGDKQVIEGLEVGLDGMRVGDKRRLIIPPSMSLGYKGTGENVPPNSWLVYDVEMTGIH